MSHVAPGDRVLGPVTRCAARPYPLGGRDGPPTGTDGTAPAQPVGGRVIDSTSSALSSWASVRLPSST